MAGKFNYTGHPNIELVRLYNKNVVGEKLDKISGTKDVVIEPDLMPLIDRIIGASALKGHNVGKFYKLENPVGPIKSNPKRVYIVSGKLQLMQMISGQIIIDRQAGIECEYTILMRPRRLHACEKILEEEGVFGYVTVEDLPVNLVVIDDDILSLESKSFFKTYFLDNDQVHLYEVAQSLCDLQNSFGKFDNTLCIGNCAKKANHLAGILSLKEERCRSQTANPIVSGSNPRSADNHFTHLIMVDRDVDLVTPLCSQVTYSGLVDDTLGVNCGFVDLGPEVTNLQKSTKVLLSSEDVIFREIRDRHFSHVSTHLSANAKELRRGYEKCRNLDLSETRQYVQNELKSVLAQHNSLSIHVAASEFISKKKTKGEIDLLLRIEHSLLEGIDIRECITYIEELINRQVDMSRCLGLLCLLSLTEGGIPTSTYRSLLLQFLQSFGYPYLPSIYNLRRVGLLTEISGPTSNLLNKVVSLASQGSFRTAARRLSLIPRSSESVNLMNPNDMSYVFSGAYTPLLCRIVEQILQDGSAMLEDVFKLLNVPSAQSRADQGSSNLPSSSSSSSSKVILVYFLGGCNYSEVAALRYMAKQRGHTVVIATTNIFNCQSFLRDLL